MCAGTQSAVAGSWAGEQHPSWSKHTCRFFCPCPLPCTDAGMKCRRYSLLCQVSCCMHACNLCNTNASPTTAYAHSHPARLEIHVLLVLCPPSWQAYFSPEFAEDTDLRSFFTSTDIASVDDCLAQCSTDFCCLAQFNAATNTCQYVQLSPAGATDVRTQLFYKLPPSAMSAASSVKQGAGASAADAAAAAAAGDGQAEASTVRSRWTNAPRLPRVKAGTKSTFAVSRKQQTSSGSSQVVAASSFDTRAQTLSSALYARCSIPVTEAAAWEKVGSQLTLDARTFSRGPDVWLNVTDLQTCQQLCDNSNTCWGGLYRDGQCLFRSGIDALRTRAFFALPAPGSVPDFVTPSTCQGIDTQQVLSCMCWIQAV